MNDHGRKTIQTVAQGPITTAQQPHQPTISMLDPFVPHLERRIAEGVLSCNEVLSKLRLQGYDRDRRLLKSFVPPY